MTALHHLGCDSCGSTLGVREGQRLVRCTHCGSEFLALIPGFIPRFRLDPTVDQRGAERVAKKTLSHGEVEKGLAKDAQVGGAKLYWVPFYEVDGLQVSTYLEKSKGRHDTRLSFADYQAQGCAEDLQDWGLADLRPRLERQRASVPLAPSTGEQLAKFGYVLPVPPVPVSALTPTALTPTDPIAGKNEIVASGAKLMATEQRYVYYPIWRVDVRAGRHPYVLTIDGLSGDLLAGRLPQDRRFASLWLLTTLALFGLILGRTLSYGVSLGQLALLLRLWPVALPLVGFLFSVLFIALAVFWSETRFRGEVLFTRHGTRVEKLGRPPETRLERWATEVGRRVERLIELSARVH